MDASGLNARQELLSEIHSKVTMAQLKILHDRYDHPEGKNPLYVRHMEYGLCLPLHPFINHVCSALGALIEHELYSQLSFAYKLPADFEKALAEEKKAREAAEKRVTVLEDEQCRNEGRWRRELQMKEDLIKGLKMHRTKQSATIEKLKGEMTKLKEAVDRLEKEVAERDARIKYLDEEVDMEKRYRLEAQEHARSERLAADHAKLDLKEERAAHEVTRAAVQAQEARVASLDSEAFKAKVVEEYRHSALGKVEVALACKTCFDYLASLLPSGSRPLTDSDYPPRVSVFLDFLREIETAGGRVALEVDEGEDNELGDAQEEAAPVAPPVTLQAPATSSSTNLPSPTPNPSRGV